jgi:hypothetical protein
MESVPFNAVYTSAWWSYAVSRTGQHISAQSSKYVLVHLTPLSSKPERTDHLYTATEGTRTREKRYSTV